MSLLYYTYMIKFWHWMFNFEHVVETDISKTDIVVENVKIAEDRIPSYSVVLHGSGDISSPSSVLDQAVRRSFRDLFIEDLYSSPILKAPGGSPEMRITPRWMELGIPEMCPTQKFEEITSGLDPAVQGNVIRLGDVCERLVLEALQIGDLSELYNKIFLDIGPENP